MADRGPVSLPLQKLSFCTTPLLHSKLVWEHLSDQTRICAVFDQVKKPGLGQTATQKHVLKLVQEGHLLVCTLDWNKSCILGSQINIAETNYNFQTILTFHCRKRLTLIV